MEPTFRASMSWLHTWAGVVLGAVLLAIFWMGTLSVFDREIDRWMMPATRLAPAQELPSIEWLQPFYAVASTARSPFLIAVFPTGREPVLRVSWIGPAGLVERVVDPRTGAVLPDPGTWAGTRFLYPFHYRLHVRILNLGEWLVGLAAMAMLALSVSGVVVHRKIFTDFFTFRAGRQPRRLILDLHNVAGVLGLPFQLAITLSGLMIFWSVYFPGVWTIAYRGDQDAFMLEALGNFTRPPAGRPADALASLDAMAAEARRSWDGGPLRYLVVRNVGDAASLVQVGRLDEARVGLTTDAVAFDASTGALLHRQIGDRPVRMTEQFIAGLHLIQFHHWSLRWLYFGLGLMGCVTIATGYLFWLESRRKKHAQRGLAGVRAIESLTIGSVTGIVVATLAFFVVNRLLPLGATFLGQDRAALEIWTFYLMWLVAFGHAWLRPRRAWVEQCWAIAALAVAAVLLNWITTGDHLARSFAHRHLWSVAGMDMLLLGGAFAAGLAAWRLVRRGYPSLS